MLGAYMLLIIKIRSQMNEEIYTVEQVANKLNCHPRTVRELIKKKELKASKKIRKWYVLHSDLLGYITSSK